MKSSVSSAARKRLVNLTLSEDLVEQARAMTDNLSGVVENLLAEFVQRGLCNGAVRSASKLGSI